MVSAKHRKNIRKSDIVRYAFLGLYVVLIVYPLLFTLMSSFKSNEEIFGSPWSLPQAFSMTFYKRLFTEFRMHTYFLNSLFYSAVVCLVGLAITTTAAYAIGRMRWKLSKAVLGLLLTGLMVPMHAIIVPLYILTTRVGITNRAALMLIFIANTIPTSTFMIIGFLKGIPREIEESAVIDGCSIPKAFARIVCPMLKPTLATVTIFNFLGVWNDLLLSLIFLNQETQKTLQLGIVRFKNAFYTDYNILLSGIIVGVLPSILVYLFMSEKIISGISAGAVKG